MQQQSLCIPKREFKKELAGKLEAVLADLKKKLGEEEFQSRLKRAAKLLTQGLHGKDFKNGKSAQSKAKKAAIEIKQAPKKSKALKKAKPKPAPAPEN